MKLLKYREPLELIFYIILAVIVVYYIPHPVNKLISLLVLPVVWRTKRDYFWIAFFLIINDYPGGLFHGGERTDLYRLPIYNLTGKISFTISELFYFLIFFKSIKKSKEIGPFQNLFRNEFILLFVFFIILIMISLPLGMSTQSFRNVYKISVGFLLFYAFLRIINNWEKINNFLRLIFPFAFISILLQIYSLITKQQLVALFKPGVSNVQGVLVTNPALGIDRPIELVHVLFICFTGSLIMLSHKGNIFTKSYLYYVSAISYISVFMTATRGWVLSFTVGYFLYFLNNIKDIKSIIRFSFVALTIGVLLVVYNPLILNQIENAWTRIFTIKELVGGDITAGGTLQRLDVRRPAIMQAFQSSTIIFGSGFSDHYFENADGHLGYDNLLFNTGILGVLVFMYLLLRIFAITIKRREVSKIVLLPIILLLIINTGTQTIGYTIDYVRIMLFAFSLLVVNLALMKSKNGII